MRRSTSPVALALLGLGVFLLVLAPLLVWYVTPRAAVNPLDIDETAVYRGTGTFYDAATQENHDGQELTITQRVIGDVDAGDRSGKAVWNVSTAVDTPETLQLHDPRRSFQWTTERLVTDRRSNRPVHCCGEDAGPAKRYAGEAYLKFPFGVERRTYLWWDNTLQDTVPLHYAGKRKIRGYTGLEFKGTVREPVKTGTRQVPGAIVGMEDRSQVFADQYYANHGIDLVADQRTGRVIYASTAPRITLRQPGGTTDKVVLLDSRGGIAFTPAYQKDQVDKARSESGRLRAVSETVPLGGGVVGLVLTAFGAALALRGRHGPDEEEPAPDGVPPQPVAA